MLSHPGETVSIYQIAQFFNEGFIDALNPSNIISGFTATGIFPFNLDVFTEELPIQLQFC